MSARLLCSCSILVTLSTASACKDGKAAAPPAPAPVAVPERGGPPTCGNVAANMAAVFRDYLGKRARRMPEPHRSAMLRDLDARYDPVEMAARCEEHLATHPLDVAKLECAVRAATFAELRACRMWEGAACDPG